MCLVEQFRALDLIRGHSVRYRPASKLNLTTEDWSGELFFPWWLDPGSPDIFSWWWEASIVWVCSVFCIISDIPILGFQTFISTFGTTALVKLEQKNSHLHFPTYHSPCCIKIFQQVNIFLYLFPFPLRGECKAFLASQTEQNKDKYHF